MEKSDYIYMIMDNILVFKINSDMQGADLRRHLENFDENIVRAVAGFSQKLLEHFLIVSKGKEQKDIEELVIKMNKLAAMISPMGTLNFLKDDSIEYILTRLDSLRLNEITEHKISQIVDEQIEKQFGGSISYSEAQALEGQLQSAAFYLSGLGYPQSVIEQRLEEVRQDPSKLDALFNAPQSGTFDSPTMFEGSSQRIERTQDVEKAIEGYIKSIKQDILSERGKKVEELMVAIRDIAREYMTENYEKVFKLIHPDRLTRILKMLRNAKRKSRRIKLYLEWLFCSHLISTVEFKVEHWQVSTQAGHG